MLRPYPPATQPIDMTCFSLFVYSPCGTTLLETDVVLSTWSCVADRKEGLLTALEPVCETELPTLGLHALVRMNKLWPWREGLQDPSMFRTATWRQCKDNNQRRLFLLRVSVLFDTASIVLLHLFFDRLLGNVHQVFHLHAPGLVRQKVTSSIFAWKVPRVVLSYFILSDPRCFGYILCKIIRVFRYVRQVTASRAAGS